MSVREFHDKAMVFAQKAMLEKRKGNPEYAKQLFHQAYTCETGAADLLERSEQSEPSRGILYRSAAWLAVQADDLNMATYLANRGLNGYVSGEIKAELEAVLTHIEQMRAADGVE